MVKKVLVVGYFNTGNAYRHDAYTAYSLKNDFNLDVSIFEYRPLLPNFGAVKTTQMLVDKCIVEKIDLVLIFSGRGLGFPMFEEIRKELPNIKIFNWFSDYLFDIPTFWLKIACENCDKSFIESAHKPWLIAHPDRVGNPMVYMPHCAHPNFYYPMDIEKDLDVVFMGTPHSDRLALLDYLIGGGINISIFGNTNMEHPWPEKFKKCVYPAVFHDGCNKVLNRAKIILNPNMAVKEYCTLSDRYFLPLATKTASVCQWTNGVEDIFQNNEIEIYKKDNYEECLYKIKHLLENEDERIGMAERGYELFNLKYNLPKTLQGILSYA